jgi:NADH-quinone oxidoreductase subunit L
MMMALGIGTMVSYSAGIFHLMTHAFFKALLFLAAGSVIHAVHTQNIFEMGGLAKKMKITAWTFAIGALALSGIFPLSGFWSKDAILAEAFEYNLVLFWLAALTALLTAFYMARLFFVAFIGKPRTEVSVHESPAVMTVPLIVLAVFAVIAGFVYTPFNSWLAIWLTDGVELHGGVHWNVMLISTLMGVAGIALGWFFYGKRNLSGAAMPAPWPVVHRLLENKYYIDEIYEVMVIRPLRGIAYVLNVIDDYVIGGAVRLTAGAAVSLGKAGSKLQNGQMQTYGLITLTGFIIFLVVLVGRRLL